MIKKKSDGVEFLVGKNLNFKFKCLEIYNKKTLNFISDLGQLLKNKKDAKQFPDANEESLSFEEKRFERASVIFAVLSTPKEHPKIPQWEMQLSAGAVCMNLVTAAQSMGLAAQWVTEWYAYNDTMLQALGGRPDIDKVAGYIYVGRNTEPLKERRRPEREDVIEHYQIS